MHHACEMTGAKNERQYLPPKSKLFEQPATWKLASGQQRASTKFIRGSNKNNKRTASQNTGTSDTSDAVRYIITALRSRPIIRTTVSQTHRAICHSGSNPPIATLRAASLRINSWLTMALLILQWSGRLGEVGCDWIMLKQVGGNWMRLDEIRGGWIMLTRVGRNWIRLDEVGWDWIMLNQVGWN